MFLIGSRRCSQPHVSALIPDMAEDEVTPEQLAAIAAENEEPEPVNYKPPAQKSVKEIQDLDKDDESLRKYKETLLGPGVTCAGNAVSGWMNEWALEWESFYPSWKSEPNLFNADFLKESAVYVYHRVAPTVY